MRGCENLVPVKGRFVGPSSPTVRGASTLDYGLLHGSLHLDMMVALECSFSAACPGFNNLGCG